MAETSSNTLYVYAREADGAVSIRNYYMSVGDNGVGKTRDGDRRTPLGVYYVIDQLDTRPLHPSYGIAAFPLDYPNARDLVLGRSGGGIWIHGVTPGPGRRPPRDTDGCLALPNASLEELAPRLRLRETPVLIARNIDAPVADRENLRAELLAAIERWREAYAQGRFVDWLALYADEFVYRGMDRDAFAGLRLRDFRRPVGRFDISEVFIARDPEERDVFVSRFRLHIDDTASLVRTHRLYWRRDTSGSLRIIAEDEA